MERLCAECQIQGGTVIRALEIVMVDIADRKNITKRVMSRQQKGVMDKQQRGVMSQQQKGVMDEQQKGVMDQQQRRGVMDKQQKGIISQQQKGVMRQQQKGVIGQQQQQKGVTALAKIMGPVNMEPANMEKGVMVDPQATR